jgi:hypothetical protein
MADEFIELIGADKVEHDLRGISARMLDVSPALAAQVRALELSEEATFAGLAGRYVDTGAVRRSLTMSGSDGAVRRLSRSSLDFGTGFHYARFLTEHVGPETEAGGLERPLPVAVLKLTPAVAGEAGHAVMRHIVGDAGEQLP